MVLDPRALDKEVSEVTTSLLGVDNISFVQSRPTSGSIEMPGVGVALRDRLIRSCNKESLEDIIIV